ncbi:MAG: cytochrome c biogenesis protein [Acidimicrobiales bacterium]
MSPVAYGTFSNQAVMFASILYALALLSHMAEWSIRRPRPAAVEAAPVPVGAGPNRSPAAAEVAEPSPDRVALAGRLGVNLTAVGFIVHLAAVVARGLAADRVPWGNMYEFTLVASLGVAGMYLAMLRRYRLGWLGLPVTGFLVVVLMLAVLTLYAPPGPLVPALQSYWLVIHVTAAMIATGAFTLGALLSALFLVKQRAEKRGTAARGYLARLPSTDDMDEVAFRVHAFGFPVWTFAALLPVRSGPSTRGAASGVGTPRRCGPSSLG